MLHFTSFILIASFSILSSKNFQQENSCFLQKCVNFNECCRNFFCARMGKEYQVGRCLPFYFQQDKKECVSDLDCGDSKLFCAENEILGHKTCLDRSWIRFKKVLLMERKDFHEECFSSEECASNMCCMKMRSGKTLPKFRCGYISNGDFSSCIRANDEDFGSTHWQPSSKFGSNAHKQSGARIYGFVPFRYQNFSNLKSNSYKL